MRMQQDVRERFAEALAGEAATHALLVAMQRSPKDQLQRCVARAASAC